MPSDKLIFLDIDGVMSTSVSNFVFGKTCVAALTSIVKATGADIVISSAHRVSYSPKYFQNLLEQFPGFVGKVVGSTPWDPDSCIATRGKEVYQFINKYTEPIQEFVVLDDFPIKLQYNKHNSILINPNTGLTEADAQKAIKILNNPVSIP